MTVIFNFYYSDHRKVIIADCLMHIITYLLIIFISTSFHFTVPFCRPLGYAGEGLMFFDVTFFF